METVHLPEANRHGVYCDCDYKTYELYKDKDSVAIIKTLEVEGGFIKATTANKKNAGISGPLSIHSTLFATEDLAFQSGINNLCDSGLFSERQKKRICSFRKVKQLSLF